MMRASRQKARWLGARSRMAWKWQTNRCTPTRTLLPLSLSIHVPNVALRVVRECELDFP